MYTDSYSTSNVLKICSCEFLLFSITLVRLEETKNMEWIQSIIVRNYNKSYHLQKKENERERESAREYVIKKSRNIRAKSLPHLRYVYI